ncbi:MAG: YbjN domain-containing protein, partial [Pseudomonadota bacterium]
EVINRFNDSQVFGRAYLIPGRNQVGVDYVIELDGGVTMDNITRNVSRWADVINAFIGHFSNAAGVS